MKTKILVLSVLTLAFASFAPVAIAQNNPPLPPSINPAPATNPDQPPIPTEASFLKAAQDYFTSFNPDLEETFSIAKGEVAVGVDSIQGGGVNLANSIRISYNAYKSIGVDALIRDSGVSGILVSEQFGPSLNFIVHDAKLSLYAHAGYHQEKIADVDRLYGEIGIRINKALTPHTFAGLDMGIQLPDGVRVFGAHTGFTF